MMISIAGTGYVGLVTGVCLAEVGHQVICFDVDQEKISMLQAGRSPIYEPGLEELMKKNMDAGRITFTDNPRTAYAQADFIFIAVGTPEKEDGSANLQFVKQAAQMMASYIEKETVIVVTKSTVPIGTNKKVKKLIEAQLTNQSSIKMVSNPEFLREGTAIHDTFHGDRIVIGAEDEEAAHKVANLYKPFSLPVVFTDIESAEMIKYASNAFLATKISFINEIANLCEKTGADIQAVAKGMGLDKRIGNQFLNAGIGFGGSCFPKDTNALREIATKHDYSFKILDAVVEVNELQKNRLYEKAKMRFKTLKGKRAAILGLAFKPNTDDIREAPSLHLIESLLQEGVELAVYDRIASNHVREMYGNQLKYAETIDSAIKDADMAFIVTEWPEIKAYPVKNYRLLMKTAIVFDGRNCHSLEEAKNNQLEYTSIGRDAIIHHDEKE